MPEEEKRKGPGDIPVDIDTSGPDVDVDIETKEEAVETAPETTEKETKEVKEETSKKEEDSKLEDYSKGVQARIAKLTRKMREAERREAAAVEYANALEKKRKSCTVHETAIALRTKAQPSWWCLLAACSSHTLTRGVTGRFG